MPDDRAPARRRSGAPRVAVRAALAVVLLASCAGGRDEGGTASLAITNVTVVDVGTGERREAQTVIVRGDSIVAVGASQSLDPPEGATIVDGGGRFLIPGLWDMHVHAAGDGRAPRFWPLLLAHGVTGVREMGGSVDSLVHWRRNAGRDSASAPRIVWSSPMLDGDPPASPHAMVVRTAADAQGAVDSLRALGVDFVKTSHGLTREAFLALAAAARRRGVAIAGEVPGAVSPEEAVAAGMRSFEHLWGVTSHCVPGVPARERELRRLDRAGVSAARRRRAQDALDRAWLAGIDSTRCDALVARLGEARIWQVPTLVANRGQSWIDSVPPTDDERRRFVPPPVLAAWEAARADSLSRYADSTAAARRARDRHDRAVVGRMARAGIPILAGSGASDAPHVYAGASLHEELQLLVESGLTPLQALRAATLAPAEFLGTTDRAGSIAAGKAANLVLLDADPLADIRNTARIHAVVHRGAFLDRNRLDALVATVAASSSH